MPERITDKQFPFSYSCWDDAGGYYGDIQFYDVKFTEDFGPIKKGEEFKSVLVEHRNAKLHCYQIMGEDEVIHTITIGFKSVPI